MKNVEWRCSKILIILHIYDLMRCVQGKNLAQVGRFLRPRFVRYICLASVRILRASLTILLSRDFSRRNYTILTGKLHCCLILLPAQGATALGILLKCRRLVCTTTGYKSTLTLVLAYLAIIRNHFCLFFHFGPDLCFCCWSSRYVGAVALNVLIILFLFDESDFIQYFLKLNATNHVIFIKLIFLIFVSSG